MRRVPESVNIHVQDKIRELEDSLYFIDEPLKGDANDSFLYPERPDVAEETINGLPKFNEKAWTWYRVNKLGKIPDEKYEEEKEKLYLKFAGLMAGKDKPFSIRIKGNEDSTVSYEIGVESASEKDRIYSSLSSVFGFADISKSEEAREKSVVWQAQCFPVKQNFEGLDRNEEKPQTAKFADVVAMAITNTGCVAKVSFIPADKILLEASLKFARDMNEEITRYLKRSFNVSVSDTVNNSRNIQNSRIRSLPNLLFKIPQDSSSFSGSNNVGMNTMIVDKYAESIERALKYRIRLLEQAKESGWFVRITVESETEADNDAAVIREAIGSDIIKLGYSCNWEKEREEKKASIILPSYMLPNIISLPRKDFIGFSLKECTDYNLNPPAVSENNSIAVGNLLWNGMDTGVKIKVSKSDLNRHMFTCGMTGSGKTNSVCSILEGMDGIPYTVIEPVKGEYHSLKGIKRRTMITGDSTVIKFNPFWFPKGASLQYHIDSLKLIISSAFDLYAAMPNILEQCLVRVYMNCGWDLSTSKNIYYGKLPESELYPTFETLCAEIRRYLDNSDFEGELKGNYSGALLSRLQSFTTGAKGELLNTTEHIRFEDWNNENVVIELDALADDSDKAIVMGVLLVQYFQFIKYSYEHKAENGLRHVFVLEEAHHLFRESKSSKGEGQNSSNHLVEMLNNLLAGIRAYGEGFIIIDQSPSAISPSVLKNTGIKLVHNVGYGEDIKLLSSVLLLNEKDKTLPALGKGEALIRFSSMSQPAMVKMDICKNKEACTIQKGVSNSCEINQYERIMADSSVADMLGLEVTRLMNVMLYQSIDYIREAFFAFIDNITRIIINKFGWDSEEYLTEEFYLRLFEALSIDTAEGEFPGNFCLTRMIKLYVMRIFRFFLLGNGISLGDKTWQILYDYREAQIYPRMEAFFENSMDNETRMVVASKNGYIYESGIVLLIMKELWECTKENREEHFKFLMTTLFGENTDEYLFSRIKEDVFFCLNNI